MIHLYPIYKKAALILTFGICSSLFSQAQICGPIVEDFDLGSMAGFSSTTQGSPDPGFTLASQGQDFFLQRCNIPSAGTTYQITTPTYTTSPSQTSLGFGFELDGNAMASQVYFFLDYKENSSGAFVSNYIAAINPVYSGNTATVCMNVAFSSIPNFVAGSLYRLNIFIVSASATNNNQCIQFDNFRTTGTVSQITLPVNFTGISARRATNGVEVLWNVAGEKEVSHYEIERSTDARNFTTVGETAATGGSSYSFIDRTSSTGIVYYRVRNVDVDGQYSYSKIVRLNLGKIIELNAYPQPVIAELTVEHNSANGKIVIASATGQVVKSVPVKAGDIQTTINVSALQPGLYILRFQTDLGVTESIKMIKQ